MPSSTDFNSQCYIARYPDLRMNKYIMYHSSGAFGVGNTTNDAFSNLNHVVMLQGGSFVLGWSGLYTMPQDAYNHFKDHGMSEGRAGGCDLPGTNYDNVFNAKAYIARYPDVKENPDYYNDPLGHFQNIGKNQSRLPGYEILSETSPSGFTSPGTTEFISNAFIQQAQTDKENQTTNAGDNTIPVATNAVPVVAPVPANSVTTFITNNPGLAALIGFGGIFLVYELSKKKKRKE